MLGNPCANELLSLLLKKRMEIVQRVEKRAEFGEPCDRKHREILAMHEEARVYAAELAGIVGEDVAQEQWELLGRVAYGLDLICRSKLLDKETQQCYNQSDGTTDSGT